MAIIMNSSGLKGPTLNINKKYEKY